jgi:hypothetical protein
MPKIIVMHMGYGCDSGCCGHIIEMDERQVGSFHFDHPTSAAPEHVRAFVTDLVSSEMGVAHVADIDWDNCIVVDD